MFQMLEVVGTSANSFSEAVKNAVNDVAKSGKKASWIQVVEQRGAIRDGQLKEYQVVLKIAVEAK